MNNDIRKWLNNHQNICDPDYHEVWTDINLYQYLEEFTGNKKWSTRVINDLLYNIQRFLKSIDDIVYNKIDIEEKIKLINNFITKFLDDDCGGENSYLNRFFSEIF